jgi:chemotaxis protein methyltransferase CheR
VTSDAMAQRFRAAIARHMGLAFDETKLHFLAELMARRAEATRRTSELYLADLEAACDAGERRALALDLTVPETYFFRHMEQMRAFSEVVLSERLRARNDTCKLRLLSAGCASGEEPYSLAILLREYPSGPGWETQVQALDMNPAVLEKARSGRYSSWALRETPKALQERWFRRVGREFELDASIRAAVEFREANLAQHSFEQASYDVIFCRNVMMYFAPKVARDLLARFTRALLPGGYLFLGHAETLRGLSNDFHLCHTHGTFYYQRKDTIEVATELGSRADAHASTTTTTTGEGDAPAAGERGWADTWVEAVQRSSARIKVLSGDPKVAPLHDARSEPSAASPQLAHTRVRASAREASYGFDLSTALELLKRERFHEALARVSALPLEARHDPDVLLLTAALLTHVGQLPEARRTCEDLLAIDDLNTGAHYLLALCCEGAGDLRGALDHDQVAIYLDATFAMPRLHLGLMARRTRDWDAARRELEQALALLRREDSSRLLLFGGGFGRDTLIALCQAEIAVAGRA